MCNWNLLIPDRLVHKSDLLWLSFTNGKPDLDICAYDHAVKGETMKLTNNLNLPQPFVDALSRDYEYKDKRYSVTAMLKGYREIILTRRHFSEMEEDASDSIWMIFGTAVHKVLEESKEAKDELKETKIYYEFPNGYTLSGQQDLYSESLKRITDYKTGSVWKVIYDDWADYRKQCLYYALLFRKIGFECDNAEIVMILKDFSKTDSRVKKGYPEHPVFIKHFDFTDEEFKEAEGEIIRKFDKIDELKNIEDDKLPLCTNEERWASQDKYAVMKKGAKKALKLCDSKDEADQIVKGGKGDYIEFRQGEDKKCKEYCSCAKWCSYWREKYGEQCSKE